MSNPSVKDNANVKRKNENIINQHLSNISKGLNELNSKHDNRLIIGDLNSEMSKRSLDEFSQKYDLQNIAKRLVLILNNQQESS